MHARAARATTAPTVNHREERVMASRIARIASLPALLLLGTTAAWAGRGDIDPNYGEGGQLVIGPSVPLVLPGDRLVIAEGTDQGFRIRMVDAAGRSVPTFGIDGVVVIDSSAAALAFRPMAAALAPNGDMIFVGGLSDRGTRALLRVDGDGQPVSAFGDRGDGFLEYAVYMYLPMGFAVEPDGKIVLLEVGSWNSGCGSTARLQRLLANGQPDTEFSADGVVEIPDLDVYCDNAAVLAARAGGGTLVGGGRSIVAIDAAGDIDTTYGAEGRLVVAERAWARGLPLPDGGLLIVASSDESVSPNDTEFLKFDRNGQPDFEFGSGTGSVTVDFGTLFLGETLAREYVGQLVLDPDGKHVVAQLSISRAEGSLACSGIARLTIDGAPDAGFGRNGMACLNFDTTVIALQADGAPLFGQPNRHFESFVAAVGVANATYRLLPDNRPSPGILRVLASTSFQSALVGESEGTAAVSVERVAGRDGAVSINYSTANRAACHRYYYCSWDSATAESDYVAASGQLDWGSGDDGQRTVTVRILDDSIHEYTEIFGIDFSEPAGGALLISAGTRFFIADDDVADDDGGSSTPPPPDEEGGGGSVSWATPLALLTLLLMRRRRDRNSTTMRSSCCA
jgi:MYXO-CTERM domain-containing protein